MTLKILDSNGSIIIEQIAGVFGDGAYTEVLLNTSEMTIPNQFEVAKAYPNPFNPLFTVEFGIPEEGQVEINIFNLMGQSVYESNSSLNAGNHTFSFDAEGLVSGMYFLQISFIEQNDIQKIILLQ